VIPTSDVVLRNGPILQRAGNRDLPTWTSFRPFTIAGEKQEKAADEETLVLLQRFSGDPDVEKAAEDFRMAQEVEERFHHDFAGLDFTLR
jgi:hypothetical protein